MSDDLRVSDFALLGITEAKLPSDGFSIVDPFDNEVDQRELVLEVAGFRHYAEKLDMGSSVGQSVEFRHEPLNPKDPNAVVILHEGETIGYINRLQTTAFHRWIREGRITAVIERFNGEPTRPRAFLFVKIAKSAQSIAA